MTLKQVNGPILSGVIAQGHNQWQHTHTGSRSVQSESDGEHNFQMCYWSNNGTTTP